MKALLELFFLRDLLEQIEQSFHFAFLVKRDNGFVWLLP